MGQTISFSLNLGSTFSFNLDTRVKATSPGEKMNKRKKPSPSTMRRNCQRKKEFLKQKRETSSDKDAPVWKRPLFSVNIVKAHSQLKMV